VLSTEARCSIKNDGRAVLGDARNSEPSLLSLVWGNEQAELLIGLIKRADYLFA
jgi:hypothetical protein